MSNEPSNAPAQAQEGAEGLAVQQPTEQAAPQTDEAAYNDWLRKSYVRTPAYYGRDAHIVTKAFFDIGRTAITDHPDAWLTEASIDVTFILLMQQKYPTADDAPILFLETDVAESLVHVGQGTPVEEFEELINEEAYQRMKDPGVRWIVMACNDGMIHGEYEQPDPSRGTSASSPRARGAHWGLLVIDKQDKRGHWLDGHLELVQNANGLWYIQTMLPAGTAAGKALGGYERVMNRRGEFTARTLKHVPHDYRHNRFKGDGGSACGPWVFAVLRYLLNRPQFWEDLPGRFRRSLQATRARELAFDSRRVRREMQEIIKTQDSGNPLPYNLILPALRHLLSLDNLLDLYFAQSGNPRLYNPINTRSGGSSNDNPDDDDDDDDDDSDKEGYPLGPSEQDLVNIIARDPDFYMSTDRDALAFEMWQLHQLLESDRSECDHEAVKDPAIQAQLTDTLEKHDVDFVHMPIAMLNEFIALLAPKCALSARTLREEWDARAVLTGLLGENINHMSRDQQLFIEEHDPAFNPEQPDRDLVKDVWKSRCQKVDQLKIRGEVRYYPGYYIKEHILDCMNWPQGTEKLPDFTQISGNELQRWVDANPELFADAQMSESSEIDRAALLHIKFNRTFVGVSAKDLKEVWVDVDVVQSYGKTESLSAKDVLDILMRKYEKSLLADLEKLRAGKKKGNKPPKPSNFSGAGSTLTTAGATSGQPDGVPQNDKTDIRKMRETEVMRQLKNCQAAKNHRAVKGKKNVHWRTYRSVLFVTKYRGTFRTEEPKWDNLWIKDPNVFVEGKDYRWEEEDDDYRRLKRSISHEMLCDRMFDTYEKIDDVVGNNPGEATVADVEAAKKAAAEKKAAEERAVKEGAAVNNSREQAEESASPRRSPRTAEKNGFKGMEDADAPADKPGAGKTVTNQGLRRVPKRKSTKKDDQQLEKPDLKKPRNEKDESGDKNLGVDEVTKNAQDWFVKDKKSDKKVDVAYAKLGLAEVYQDGDNEVDVFSKRNRLFAHEGGNFYKASLQCLRRVCVRDPLFFKEGIDWERKGNTAVICLVKGNDKYNVIARKCQEGTKPPVAPQSETEQEPEYDPSEDELEE